MLPKKIIAKPSLHIKDFGKYGKRKMHQHHKREQVACDDKENQQSLGNMFMQTVDISKKIKKKSPKKYIKFVHSQVERFNGYVVFKDEDIGFDPEFINMTRPIRMDNDVDTDEEQIKSGVSKMQSFLKEACLGKMYQNGLAGEVNWMDQQSKIK